MAFNYLPLQGGTGLIPGWGTMVPHAVGCSQKLKKKLREREKTENPKEKKRYKQTRV